jgi:hypothetical protein
MAKKAEPKFKITETSSGRLVDGVFKKFVEQRLDKVTLPKSFDGVLVIPQEVTQIGRYHVPAKKIDYYKDKEHIWKKFLHHLIVELPAEKKAKKK